MAPRRPLSVGKKVFIDEGEKKKWTTDRRRLNAGKKRTNRKHIYSVFTRRPPARPAYAIRAQLALQPNVSHQDNGGHEQTPDIVWLVADQDLTF